MRTLLLDYKKFEDKETFHPYMKKKLKIEGYFGNNLDAMWDAMSYLREELRLCIYNWEDYEKDESGSYSESVVKTLRELSEQSGNIKLDFITMRRLT